MSPISLGPIALLAGLIMLLSSIAFLINHFIYQFPANNFLPDNLALYALLLVFLNLGLMFYFKKNSKPRQAGQELLYFFSLMILIGLASNAVQLTPFSTVDHYIFSLESTLHIQMDGGLIWTNNHPQFKKLLAIIYDSLAYQMSILPLVVIASCRIHLLREYYFLLLCTTLFGFTFYYFFPTTAPASIIDSPLFSSDQIATGLKFKQIHNHIKPTTNAGGLIALPSFHVIWAILCVNLLKEWPIPYVLLLPINLLLIASCVLLGWHYSLDILGSFIILYPFYLKGLIFRRVDFFAPGLENNE